MAPNATAGRRFWGKLLVTKFEMGIRFSCPNCRKALNVKSNLAGRRARCPHCTGRLTIPSDEPQVGSQSTESSLETSSTGGERPAAALAQAQQVFENLDPDSFLLDRPEHDTTAFDAPAPFDWINDAPEAVWYLRDRDGKQYGPIKGFELRTWLDEGRVRADGYVWREGWANWRQTADVFPDRFQVTGRGNIAADPSARTARGQNATSQPPTASRGQRAHSTPEGAVLAQAPARANGTWLFLAILIVILTIGSVAITTVVIILRQNQAIQTIDPNADPNEIVDPFAPQD